jgi:hypothetical protein
MQDVRVKLNRGLTWQKQHLTETKLFPLNLNLRKKQLNFYIWSMVSYGAETCNTSGSRSEIPGKLRNVMLEKNGEDRLD